MHTVQIRVTKEDLELWKGAAAEEHLKLATYMASMFAKAADKRRAEKERATGRRTEERGFEAAKGSP